MNLRYQLLISVISILMLSACVGKRLENYAGQFDSYDQLAYVIDHGFHTAVVVDAKPLLAKLGLRDSLFWQFKYIEIGRGDAGFYRAEDETVLVTLKALFLSTPAVLHLSAYNKLPVNKFPLSQTIGIKLSKSAMEKLLDAIVSDFSLEEGRAIELAPGRDKDSRFFQSKGSYHLFYTCNNWTADMIEQAGYPINHRWSFFSDSVMDQLDDVQDYLNPAQ
ncbi:MAG: hypothetical protein ACI8XX_002360 [Polaribacter sp.]